MKKERILIAGFLQRCDHFASWCEKEGESLDRVEIEPKAEDEIENKIAGKVDTMPGSLAPWQITKIKCHSYCSQVW